MTDEHKDLLIPLGIIALALALLAVVLLSSSAAAQSDESVETLRRRVRNVTPIEAHATFLPDGGCLLWTRASLTPERIGYVVGSSGLDTVTLGDGPVEQTQTPEQPGQVLPARCLGLRLDALKQAARAFGLDGGN